MPSESPQYQETRQSTAQRPGGGGLGRSVAVKVVFVSIVALLLLIPLSWVRSLVREREDRAEEARCEISRIWGKEQTIIGPILSVPFRAPAEDKGSGKAPRIAVARFLPDDLQVRGTIRPERRYYGIFDVIVYQVDLEIAGSFAVPDADLTGNLNPVAWQIPDGEVLWDQASLAVGIPDVRGISKAVALQWGDRSIDFLPGTGSSTLPSGIHAVIGDPRDPSGQETSHPFRLVLTLNGSNRLQLLPLGKQTAVSLSSSWPSPSFSGAYLPSSRQIREDGFSAEWQIPYFGRSYPQSWTSLQETSELHRNLQASAFGVELIIPVDLYQKTTRSVKYGLLFIGLTFLSFFLVELFNPVGQGRVAQGREPKGRVGGAANPVRLHPFQYLLVGFAISLFYLLLLSLAEHTGFGPAYLLSTAATVLLVSGYCRSVLAGWGRSVLMALVLSGLYGFLWILLIGEDYSLLSGSLGLFAILAVVMYLTRRLDWYNLEIGANNSVAES